MSAIGANAAALGVAEHDDMLHLQRHDGVFERGGGAVKMVVRLIGRHQRRDIAQHEEFARAGVEDRLRRDAGVAAADHHGRRTLALYRQGLEPRLLRAKTAGEKNLIAIDEMWREDAGRLAVVSLHFGPSGIDPRGRGPAKADGGDASYCVGEPARQEKDDRPVRALETFKRA